MASHDQLFDRSAKKRHFIAGFSNDLMDIGHPVPICSNFEIHTKGSIRYLYILIGPWGPVAVKF